MCFKDDNGLAVSYAVKAEHLSKNYKIFHRQSARIWYYLFKTGRPADFAALDDLTFTVRKGETFGIIGRNGSGKSTTLQLLAGIIQPTSGMLTVCGKVAALLELGSGFDPESTGRENIYINSAVLGLNKKEIEGKADEIISFADIGNFLDQPVKTYSSGMYVRLAFAIAINVEAEIILIDEALAVGDIFFRQKCYTRLNELKEQGKTIILVSHGMNEVEQFCDRTLLLNAGKQVMLGSSQDAVKWYYLLDQEGKNAQYAVVSRSKKEELSDSAHETKSTASEPDAWTIREQVFFDLSQSEEISNGKARFLRAGLFDKEGKAARVFEQGDSAYFYIQFEVLENIAVPACGTLITNQKNTILHGKSSVQTYCNPPEAVNKGAILTFVECVQLNLEDGEMTLQMGLSEYDSGAFNRRAGLPNEELYQYEKKLCMRNNIGVFAIIQKKTGCPTRLTHYGACDLPARFFIAVTDPQISGGDAQ
jgi:ABC-type polysaccharide/polyol phosphate transport system ATPase subunit